MAELTDDELIAELGISIEPEFEEAHSPRQARIRAGFEDILYFREEHGRAPTHAESADIFERMYAVRLERLRELPEARELLAGLDAHRLLNADAVGSRRRAESLDDDALLAELGGDSGGEDDIGVLKHVRSADEKRTAEEVASRDACRDFEKFKPLFEQVERELQMGTRQSRSVGKAADVAIEKGDFFVIDGLTVYVAEVGELSKTSSGQPDARLRVIYSNGTESNLLLRSLQRVFYSEDSVSRRLVIPESGQLSLGDSWDADDVESGTIYVLRSDSTHPYIAQHREVIHKIGVTGGKPETRIANALHEATYLLAGVQIITTYKLAGINRVKLENVLHRVFSPAQIDITIPDRFGHPVQPREWFLVPLPVIDEAVARIRDGSIAKVVYDPQTAQLIEK
jgi:hypothetical protein